MTTTTMMTTTTITTTTTTMQHECIRIQYLYHKYRAVTLSQFNTRMLVKYNTAMKQREKEGERERRSNYTSNKTTNQQHIWPSKSEPGLFI